MNEESTLHAQGVASRPGGLMMACALPVSHTLNWAVNKLMQNQMPETKSLLSIQRVTMHPIL